MKIFQEKNIEFLISNPQFLIKWDELWTNCPWSTVFQHRDFVMTWYKFYPFVKPIIISDWDGENLSGLLTLAIKDNGEITGAGFDQAEYQNWLCLPESNEKFIFDAIKKLRIEFPQKILHLKYLSPQTPTNFFEDNIFLKKHSNLKVHQQPILELEKQRLELELKKKNKKEKINRLKRLGELHFHEISSLREFKLHLDEMILLNDFRKGALYGKTVFQSETQRKLFLLEMFELGHLHVSVLKLNGILIAANVGFVDQNTLYLQGINSHSPFFSKYSPGILHFLTLGIHLSETGKKYFDLTPGGVEGYKSMLATSIGNVEELWVSNRQSIYAVWIKESLKEWVSKLLVDSGMKPYKFLSLITTLKKICLNFKRNLSLNRKLNFSGDFLSLNSAGRKVYLKMPNCDKGHQYLFPDKNVNVNLVSDLFLHKKIGVTSTKEFLSDSLRRIELGQEMFTVVSNNELMALFWLIFPTQKNVNDFCQKKMIQGKFILNCSFYCQNLLPELDFIFCKIIELKLPEIKSEENLIIEIDSKQRFMLKFLRKNKHYDFVEN